MVILGMADYYGSILIVVMAQWLCFVFAQVESDAKAAQEVRIKVMRAKKAKWHPSIKSHWS